jgi:hypothetical protein
MRGRSEAAERVPIQEPRTGFPHHFPNGNQPFSLAAFHVTLIGRIGVIPEAYLSIIPIYYHIYIFPPIGKREKIAFMDLFLWSGGPAKPKRRNQDKYLGIPHVTYICVILFLCILSVARCGSLPFIRTHNSLLNLGVIWRIEYPEDYSI